MTRRGLFLHAQFAAQQTRQAQKHLEVTMSNRVQRQVVIQQELLKRVLDWFVYEPFTGTIGRS